MLTDADKIQALLKLAEGLRESDFRLAVEDLTPIFGESLALAVFELVSQQRYKYFIAGRDEVIIRDAETTIRAAAVSAYSARYSPDAVVDCVETIIAKLKARGAL